MSSIWGLVNSHTTYLHRCSSRKDIFMALELETGSLAEVTGTVVYPQEFFE